MDITKVIKKLLRTIIKKQPLQVFHSMDYLRHNQRRLEHLASLGLNIEKSYVLEVGAGIGDHTNFFLDRYCRVVSTDSRIENIKILKRRHPDLDVRMLDLENPKGFNAEKFDIVYCYGLLYHLSKPAEAIKFMSDHCKKMILLETCVSFGEDVSINLCDERKGDPSQSYTGLGCRPTRKWVFNELKKYFKYVYMPITQPYHREFPVDWTKGPQKNNILLRAIFIASREKIKNDFFIEDVPNQQKRM